MICLNTQTMHRDKMEYTLHSPALFNHVLTMFYHLSCNMHNFVKPCTKGQDGTVAGMHVG